MCDGFSEAALFAMGAAGAEGGGVGAGLAATAATATTTMGTIGGALGAVAGGMGMGGALAVGSAALAVGSAAMSGVSAAMQTNAQQQSEKYQSQVDANNATIARQQESATIQQGQAAAMQQEYQAAQVLGSQKANLAANGLDMTSGSAIDLMATTKFLNASDVNTIQSNAARQAWGYGVDASNSQAAGGLAAWQAKNTSPAGTGAMSGATSLLGTASMYAMGNKTNLFNSLTF